MRTALAIAIFAAGVIAANGQEERTHQLARYCTVAATAKFGEHRLYLGDSLDGERHLTYVQINGPLQLSGSLKDISIKVEPFDAVNQAAGLAVNSGSNPYIRAVITEGWSGLLNRIRKGDKLVFTSGGEVISVSLAGSGAAVNALERCSK